MLHGLCFQAPKQEQDKENRLSLFGFDAEEIVKLRVFKEVRPFQVFSLFRITLACENLTGRQGIKKKRPRKKRWIVWGNIVMFCHVMF